MGRFDDINREDSVMKTERRLVGKYNRVMFGIGIVCAIIIPPLIYRWKRGSMEVQRFFIQKLEKGAKDDIERVYKAGRSISEIPRR